MLVFRTPLIAAMTLIISATANVPAAFATPSSPARPGQVSYLPAAGPALTRPALADPLTWSVLTGLPARAEPGTPPVASGSSSSPRSSSQQVESGGGVPPAEIPDRAMLRPTDLGGSKPYPVDGESWPKLRPPRPCGAKTPAPSADRAVSAVIDVDQAPVVVLEYLALHRSEQAARDHLRGLRTALRGCDDKTWKLLSSGRDRLVLRWSQSWEHVDQQITHHTYVVVARTGPVVVVVADVGWETSDGDQARAELLVTRAVKRASALH